MHVAPVSWVKSVTLMLMALRNEELLDSPTILPVMAWRRISSPEPLLKKKLVSASQLEKIMKGATRQSPKNGLPRFQRLGSLCLRFGPDPFREGHQWKMQPQGCHRYQARLLQQFQNRGLHLEAFGCDGAPYRNDYWVLVRDHSSWRIRQQQVLQ